MQHIVLDLETLGVETDSVILSIGAAVFDDVNPTFIVQDTFYRNLDTRAQIVSGRTIDQNTIDWWNHPDRDTARMLSNDKPVQAGVALVEFGMFCNRFPKDTSIWGNGSDFDVSMLRSLMRTFGMVWPMSYKNTRCMRTLRGVLPWHACWDLRFEGIPHFALDDARHEAEMIHMALQAMRNGF